MAWIMSGPRPAPIRRRASSNANIKFLRSTSYFENWALPEDLNASVNHRDYKSLNDLTPAEIYFGCGETILFSRVGTKRNIINQQHLQYRNQTA
jgi:putative transposase